MHNPWRPLLLLLLVLALCAAPENAQARFDAARVKQGITALGAKAAAAPDLPGLSIAVRPEGGDEPVTAAFGMACLENPAPLTDRSRFKIGSVTKVFTGALVHRAIEQGALSYDTTIDRFFPAFPNGGAITIRNLLEHTSGVFDMLDLPAVNANTSRTWTPDELIALVAEQPPLFKPGAQQVYSNTGFLMLAAICERVSGRSYAELVRSTPRAWACSPC